MSILFITPYPSGEAPSQRFRFEQYLEYLNNKHTKIKIAPFLSKKSWVNLYLNKGLHSKFTPIILGFIKRFILFFSVYKYRYIFIHREATPVGPPWFEFIIAKILRKRIIYDFDDAIWVDDPDEKNTFLAKMKWKKKTALICKWSYKISVGNEYLAEFARQYNENVIIMPTTIDTINYHNPNIYRVNKNPKRVTIGWTGSHSTLQYLDPIINVIRKLEQEFQISFLVIANKKPNYKLSSLQFLKWNKKNEIADLMRFDIGIMPLSDDEWSQGKCGFKILQYMALGVPSVASPVGVNKNIIQNGINGFLASTPDDFYNRIKTLIIDRNLQNKISLNGRQKVVAEYSVLANKDQFLSLFY